MATLKQQKAIKKTLENGGNVTQAMREVGYAETTIHNPKNLTESKAFMELFQETVTDELLAQKHLELLNKREVAIRNNVTSGEIEVIPTGELDVQAVKAGLDMAYKLKGSYAPEKSVAVQVKADIKDFAQHDAIREKYEAELLEQYQND
jgi:hypothetical protein